MNEAQLEAIERAVKDAPKYDINTPDGQLVLAAFRFVHCAHRELPSSVFDFIRDEVRLWGR